MQSEFESRIDNDGLFLPDLMLQQAKKFGKHKALVSFEAHKYFEIQTKFCQINRQNAAFC